MQLDSNSNKKNVIGLTILVAALGYFVDVYDLVLFLIIGKKSLMDLYPSWSTEVVGDNFSYLLDVQMIGMLLGGIFWGILGDKKGRLSVLFGSILTYSLANIANGFATDLNSYAILRFIAGFGLAGELGAGITLVSESMDKEKRGYGTMLVAAVGVVGAVVAGFLADKVSWQISYFIGGGLGLSLLMLRIGVFESGMFEKSKNEKVSHGDFFLFFKSKERFYRFLNSIFIGLPVWFVIGFLISKDGINIAKKLGVVGEIKQNWLILFCYTGLVLGDLCSGTLSQILRSRKKAILIFYILTIAISLIYLNVNGVSNTIFYAMISSLGFSVGFWALFVTNASEQFGINLRSTSSNTIPNFIRGSVPLIGLLYAFVFENVVCGDLIQNYYVLLGIIITISLVSLYFLKETFGKDMNYLEK
jgi:MFS transporter, putative metabolite:H+ symporter